MKRKLTTAFAMDVVGYSWMLEQDEEGTLDRLKAMRTAIVEPAFTRHANGRSS